MKIVKVLVIISSILCSIVLIYLSLETSFSEGLSFAVVLMVPYIVSRRFDVSKAELIGCSHSNSDRNSNYYDFSIGVQRARA